MLYQSTRDKSRKIPSMEAIKAGISPEGGLFVPGNIPYISDKQIDDMIHMSYQQRAQQILQLFLTDFTEEQLSNCIMSAYNNSNFDSTDIAPVIRVSDNIFIQELWHGPTCAFKDMALQILPHFMTVALKETGEKNDIIILTATSGDTGKAALEGFKDVPGTHIVVFFPDEGVSLLQRLQMTTQEGNNVNVVSVEGNFDDAQTGVKTIFTDKDLDDLMSRKKFQFSSANSINWGRLVPQIVYYFSAYLDMLKSGQLERNETFNVVVPTGNFGNILAAYYSRMMGVPIHKLICASNSNNVLTDFINTGVYNRNRELLKTISPSMDILISSNLERLLFELADRSDEQVKKWMDDLVDMGQYSLEGVALHKLQDLFWAGYATEEQTIDSIKRTYDDLKYVLDPHTAVGKWVYDDYMEKTGDKHKVLIVSTASPYKFPHDVLRAIIGEKALSDKNEFAKLDMLQDISSLPIPKALSELQNKVILHNTCCEKEKMMNVVKQLFQI